MFLYLEAEVNVFEDCIPKSPGKNRSHGAPPFTLQSTNWHKKGREGSLYL